jgi:hypothetical protein
MSLGYVFMTNDGTTVDVTYNQPTYSGVSPTSPATGDYWYDTVNNIWKRYDGASFQIINRTFIGMVVLDSTNCVAARSADFYADYKDKSTIELEVASSSVVQAKRQAQSINVAGKDISYGFGTLPSWVGANNYASAGDYYSTFNSSTTYYLYIKDDGAVVISDIAPYWRPDLYGHYHHHNPWRCVGVAATDGSSNWSYACSMSTPNRFGNRAELHLDAANGHGSGNTCVLRWSNIRKQTGTAIAYTDDSTNGGYVTITQDGLYTITACGQASGASSKIGIVVNGTAGATALGTPLTYAQGVRAWMDTGNTGAVASCSWTGYLSAGDTVWAQDSGSDNAANTACSFTVCKIND